MPGAPGQLPSDRASHGPPPKIASLAAPYSAFPQPMFHPRMARRPHVRIIYQKQEVRPKQEGHKPSSLKIQSQIRPSLGGNRQTVSTFPPEGLFTRDAATI